MACGGVYRRRRTRRRTRGRTRRSACNEKEVEKKETRESLIHF